MKKCIVLVLGMALSVFTFAQTQQQTGIVKTRGRMVNGQLVRGKGIPEAVVQLADRSVVSKKSDGGFSIPVKGALFRVKSVQKAGYQLLDPQVCREYTFSRDTLYLVMETPEQLHADEMEKQRILRRNMEKRLQEKEDEISAMNIERGEKNRLLGQINLHRDENEKKIAELAKYYATLDYDAMDSFQRQVNSFMEEGEIEQAFALLRSRGGMDSRVREIRQEQAIEKEEEEELARQQQTLAQGKEGTRRKLEDVAKDCYNYYRGFYEMVQIDSAIHYIKLRASLDTTNLAWQYDAFSFLCLPWGYEDEAIPYFQRIRRNSSPTDKVLMDSYSWMGVFYHENDDYSKALECYTEALRIADFLGEDLDRMVFSSHIANYYSEQGDYLKAVEYLQNTLPIIKDIYGSDDSLLASTHDRIGNIYKKMGDYSKALEYYKKALELRKDAVFFEKAESYFNISLLYKEKGDLSKALKNGLTAVSIMEEEYPGWENHMTYCDWVGNLYFRMGKMTDALAYYQKAIDLYEADNTPDESDMTEAELCYEVAGRCCDELEDYSKSVEYYMKAIPMLEELQGPDDLDLALLYNKVGHRQFRLSNYEEALENYGKAVNIFIKNYGQDHPDVATIYDNMGTVDLEAGSYVGAFLYFKKALDIRERLYGPDHPNLVGSYENLSTVYYVLDDSETGLKYYEKAEELKKKASAN